MDAKKQIVILGGGFAGGDFRLDCPLDVVCPIRRLCPRTNLVMREVEDIDLKNKVVTVSPGFALGGLA